MKMNPNIKNRWITALKNGGYKQCRVRLIDKGGSEIKHCCLGVLTDLYIQDRVPSVRKTNINNIVFETGTGFLHMLVKEWAGLFSKNPFIAGKTATFRNDIEKLSFKEIAELIENDSSL